MTGLRDRVRHFIEGSHWLTDGEWKESVLRHFLRRSLPRTIEVGRGFVVSPKGASRQIDVLVFDAAKPILFRDGDLVFVTPDAVVAIIEVKTRLDSSNYTECLDKISSNLDFLSMHRRTYMGLFAYESTLTTATALTGLQSLSKGHGRRVIDIVCLGHSHFVRFCYLDPVKIGMPSQKWHSYRVANLAYGYFIHNCVELTNPQSVAENNAVWYPVEGKENSKDAEIGLTGDLLTLNHP